MRSSQDLLGLEGRGVLVTGASSGIGRAVAQRLDQVGARVLMLGRDASRLDAVLSVCEGGGHQKVVHDLGADLDGIPGLLQSLASEFGKLAGMVHCAGVQLTKPLRMLTANDLLQVQRINVDAGLMLAKGFRHRQVRDVDASIVFVSSAMGLVGAPGRSVYSASKGAVAAMTRSLALELAPEQIRVNALAPGFVRSEMLESMKEQLTEAQLADIERMHPLGFGEPHQVADAALFLLGRLSSWVTGSTLAVDGGYTAH